MMPIRTLIIEDSAEFAQMLADTLRVAGFEPAVERVETADALAAALHRQAWDIVFCDHGVAPSFNSLAALSMVQAHGLQVPFIVVSGRADEGIAASVLAAGASDFIPKGQNAQLLATVRRELDAMHWRTECRRALASARQSESRFALFYEHAPVAYHSLDRDGFLMDANPAWSSLMEYDREDVVGRWFGSLLVPEQAARFQKELPQCTNQGRWEKAFTLVTKRGRQWNVLARGQAVLDEQGAVGHTCWILRELPPQAPTGLPSEVPSVTQPPPPSANALKPLLPMCMFCKKVREPDHDWHPVEEYLTRHASVRVSHGICPQCIQKFAPDLGAG